MLKRSLRASKALFSSTRIERRQQAVERPAQIGRRVQWVISRALCLYRCFDFSAVPSRRRKAALQFELNRWSPFARTGHYVVWSGAWAQVWIWDDGKVGLSSPDALGLEGEALPESVLRGLPVQDGLELVATWDGTEARLWRAGVLSASLFWDCPPDASLWSRLVRGLGLPATTNLPANTEFVLSEQPWSGQSGFRLPFSVAALERSCAATVLMAGVTALSWQGAAALADVYRLDASLMQVEALEQQAAPLLEARTAAELAADRVRALAVFSDEGSEPNAALAQLAELLAAQSATVREWHQSGSQVRVVLETATAPLQLVKILQKEPRFGDVSSEPGSRPGTVVLSWRAPQA